MRLIELARTLWQVFGQYRWHIAALAALGFIGAILEGIGINAAISLVSFFMGEGATPVDFISRSIQGLFHFLSIPYQFRYLLAFILLLFILRAVAMSSFGYIRGWITADFLSNESQNMLRGTLFASWPFLLTQKIGHVHNTLVRDIQRTSSLLEVVSQVIQSVTGFFMYLLVALNISPLMTSLTLVGGGALLFFARPFLRWTRDIGTEMASTEKQIAQFLSEHIIGMKSIKAAAAEERAFAFGQGILNSLRRLYIRMVFVRSLNTSLFQPFSLVFITILFVIMYRLPGFSIISFGAALYLIQKIFIYLESTQGALHAISELVPYAKHVAVYKKTLYLEREVREPGTKPFVFKNSLRLEDVSFSYKRGATVLSGVTCRIARGETVGVVGPSGAGKTSLADLILRLFKPTGGRITLDGVPAEEVGLAGWREHIGYVSQDVFLFNGTIEENIRFYRSEMSKENVIAAAKQANIYDFIQSLPEGFETSVGDRGVMISGGQRQRIVLARALAGHPELLILDEATSALDHESEKLIHEAIRDLRGNVTVFIIAHRLSTVENADSILVVDGGRIVEQGSPEELLQNPDSYYARQLKGQR